MVSSGQLYTAILGLTIRSTLPSAFRLMTIPLIQVESSTEEPSIWTTLTLSTSKLPTISGNEFIQAWATSLLKN